MKDLYHYSNSIPLSFFGGSAILSSAALVVIKSLLLPWPEQIKTRNSVDSLTSGDRRTSYDNGRAINNGVIVVASFAVVLVSMTWVRAAVGAAVVLRGAGAVHVFDVLCDLLGPVVLCGQISGGVWRERGKMNAGG